MKKFFSAILLMTIMVFSVSTFVSCNDTLSEIENVKVQTGENADAIELLNNEIAALKTALASAQKAADDAKASADKAAEAAAQAKADAIAEAKTLVEGIKTAYDAEIAKINNELAGKVSQEELAAAVEAAKKDVTAAVDVINASLSKLEAALEEKVDASTLDAKVAELLAADGLLQTQIDALKKYDTENTDKVDSLFRALDAAQDAIDVLWEDLNMEGGIKNQLSNLANRIDATDADLTELNEMVFGEYGLSAEVGRLAGIIGMHTEQIDALTERMDAVDAKIKAYDNALSVYNTLIEALASQIQSIVFVPESNYSAYNKTVNSYAYTLGAYGAQGTYKAPATIKATFEVSPKALVEKITDQNVYFTTVPFKTVPADVFDAEIVSKDATTGRIEVRGFINPTSDTYKALYRDFEGVQYPTMDPMWEYNGVAVSLNIADNKAQYLPGEEDVMVDPGTYVQSEYLRVSYYSVQNIYDNSMAYFAFADVNGPTTWYSKTSSVSWDTPVSESARNLFPTEILVRLEGEWKTLAAAEAYLGTDLAISYDKDYVGSYNSGDGLRPDGSKLVSPIKMTVNGLASSAQLQATPDYPADKANNHYAYTILGQGAIKVNGNALGYLYAEGQYKIGRRTLDVTFSPVTKQWNYKEGDWAQIPTQELTVTSNTTTDITEIYGTNVTYPFVAYDAFENPIATADITVLSSKVVRLSNVRAQYAQGKTVTYDFVNTISSAITDFASGFSLTLGAMPTDKTITLDAINRSGFASHDFTQDIAPIARVLLTDNQFYGNITLADLVKDWNLVRGASEVKVDGEVKTGAAYLYVQDGLEKDGKTVKDASYIWFNSLNEYDDKYTISQVYNICGVDYKFVVDVNFTTPSYVITPNPVYVKNGVVTLDGKVTIPELAGNKLGLEAGSDYVLNAVILRDYVKVAEKDVPELGKEIALAYVYTTTYYNEVTKKDELIPGIAINQTTGQVSWNGANHYNSVDFVIALVSTQITDDKGNPHIFSYVPVTTVVPELVAFEAPTTKKVKETYLNGDGLTAANIVGNLVVTDVKTGKKLYNTYAKNLNEIWQGYARPDSKTPYSSTGVNVFDVYNQSVVEIDVKNIKGYLASGTPIEYGVDYKVQADPTKPNYGEVSLLINTGNITENITVEVPVKMTHDFCGVPHTATAMVEFAK